MAELIERTNMFFNDNIGHSPERDLWIMVLVSAIKSVLNGDVKDRRWLLSDAADKPGAFLWICRELRIDSWKEIREIVIAGLGKRRIYTRIKKLHRVNTQSKG